MKYLRSVLLFLFMTTCAMELQVSATPTKLSPSKETTEELLKRCRKEKAERAAQREANKRIAQREAAAIPIPECDPTKDQTVQSLENNETNVDSSQALSTEEHEAKRYNVAATKIQATFRGYNSRKVSTSNPIEPITEEQAIDASQKLRSKEETIQALSFLHPWKAANLKRCLTVKSQPLDSSQVLSTEEYKAKQEKLAMQNTSENTNSDNTYETPFDGHSEEDTTTPKHRDPIDDITARARFQATIKAMYQDFIAPFVDFLTDDQPEQTKGFREASAGMTIRQRYHFTLRTMSNHANAFRNDCGQAVATVIKTIWPRS